MLPRAIEVLICLKKKVLREMLVVEWRPRLTSKEIFFQGEKVLKDLIRSQTEKSFSLLKSTKRLKTV